MLRELFEKILEKIKNGVALTVKEKIALWAKKMGFFGTVYGIIAAISLILSLFGAKFFGIIAYWDIFLVTVSIFATKNWDALVLLYKKQYDRFF